METMELSSQSKGLIYDEVRQQWVSSTPEERVRQKLLKKMIYGLSYPRELLSIEKSLAELCVGSHLVPSRRVDIVCFAKGKGAQPSLYPILIIECKEKAELLEDALAQVKGYNHFLKAPFIAVAHPEGEVFGYPSEKGTAFLPHLPTYQDLISSVNYG